MYHNKPKNQQKSYKKKPQTSGNKSSLPIKSDIIVNYVKPLRGFGKEIFNYLYSWRHKKSFRASNARIAEAVKCDERSVQRWTSRFEKDGFIKKYRPHKYAINQYCLTDIMKHGIASYTYYLRYIQNSVVRAKSSLKFIISCAYIPLSLLCIHTEADIIDRYPYTNFSITGSGKGLVIQEKKKHRRKQSFFTGKHMLKQATRDFILKNKDQPALKQYLFGNEEIRKHIFTPAMERLSRLVGLTEQQQLKLVAFEDQAIEYAILCWNEHHSKGGYSYAITDTFVWCINKAVSYCNTNNIKPEWQWYFEICEILGIPALMGTPQLSTENKQLNHRQIVDSSPKKPITGLGRAPRVWDNPSRTEPSTVEELQKEIFACQTGISEASSNCFSRMILPVLEKQLEELQQKLANLQAASYTTPQENMSII